MLKNLVKKVDNVQELMDNLRRDGNYKKKSSARNIVSEIKNFFNRFPSTVDTEESVNVRLEITQIEHKEKNVKKRQSIQEVWVNIQRSNTCHW